MSRPNERELFLARDFDWLTDAGEIEALAELLAKYREECRAEERAAVVAHQIAKYGGNHTVRRAALEIERGEHLTDPPPSPWSRERPSEAGWWWCRRPGQPVAALLVAVEPDGVYHDYAGDLWHLPDQAEWCRATTPK